jgi:ACS family hexuronate transporter-like MFS transporter
MSANRRWLLLGLLIAAGIINYADRQIIAVLKPLLERDLHWSDQDYGLLASIFQFSAAISYLGVGWFVDKVGLKWANPLAVGAWSLAAMAHTVVRTFAGFAIARVALGATEAVYTPAAVKTVAVFYAARERGMALGLLNAANNLGAIVTPLVVPWLAVTFGWRSAFLVIGAAGLIWVAAWFPLMFGKIEGPARIGAAAAPKLAKEAKVGWGEILVDRRTWAVVGAKALSDQVWWFLLFWTPDLLHRMFHLNVGQIGWPLATIYACAAVGSLLGGYVSGRLLAMGIGLNAARKLTLLACGLLATPVALVPIIHSLPFAIALLGLTLAAHQGFSTNLFALITDIIPSRQVGSVTSLSALFGNLAGMSILAVVGFSLSHGGDYLPFFVLISISYLMAVGWIQLWLPRLRAASAAEDGSGEAAHG